MDVIGPKQIELKVHGVSREEHGRVPGRVFANKLKQLVSALEAADIATNGEQVHEYVLAGMHMSDPTALLAEVLRVDDGRGASAIPSLNEAVEAIKANSPQTGRLAPVVKRVALLTAGAKKDFDYAVIRTANPTVIRIDDFLRKRAAIARQGAEGGWYDGIAYGSFDGMLEYVDLRGALPQIKLTLSAGGKELDCVCSREAIDDLGDALSHRVRIHGRAIYSSSSPLPIRVEVSSIEPIKKDGDLSRWRGAFRPFTIASWDGDA